MDHNSENNNLEDTFQKKRERSILGKQQMPKKSILKQEYQNQNITKNGLDLEWSDEEEVDLDIS